MYVYANVSIPTYNIYPYIYICMYVYVYVCANVSIPTYVSNIYMHEPNYIKSHETRKNCQGKQITHTKKI